MKDPVLVKATRFLRRGRYNRAIKLLEPEVIRYRGNFTYYYILALAYLRTGIFNYAFDYFKRAREVKDRDRDLTVLLGLGVLYLRRGETKPAVSFYLKVQELDEHNRIARKALKIIRKYSGTESLRLWADGPRRLKTLFPPPPPEPITTSTFVVPLACMFVAGALTYAALIWRGVLPMPIKLDFSTKRDGFSAVALELEERMKPVEVGGSYRYILTVGQVLDTYEEARDLFNKRHDELAKRNLNRILESNASESIKAKATLLISYMDTPGFDTLRDRFAYTDVKKEPAIYRDCYVIWRGMATNFTMEETSTSFDFLVGYDTRSVLQGIVPVHFNFSVAVNPEQPLEVLGRVVPISTDNSQNIKLEGLAIHQTALPFATRN
ncbi:MAG: tetratricopeptide repeat protein [Treponema sp.]|nr:tetratricopeptide repeat protein [Treponema sp.]